jgi:RNA polymerase sigma factor (sigma-70 family)
MSALPEARSDEVLLRLTPHEPEAFATFYRRHENAMLVFFLRRGANAELAADLTAEVFAGALSSVRRFRPGRQPAVAWLYAIANHKLSSSHRRGRVEDRARSRLGMEPIVLTDERLEAVEALADAERSTQVIEDLLAQLPVEQREALRMRIVDEREYLDIAGELSCSPAVVRQRVSRALKALRRELSKEMS